MGVKFGVHSSVSHKIAYKPYQTPRTTGLELISHVFYEMEGSANVLGVRMKVPWAHGFAFRGVRVSGCRIAECALSLRVHVPK